MLAICEIKGVWSCLLYVLSEGDCWQIDLKEVKVPDRGSKKIGFIYLCFGMRHKHC